MKKGFLLFLATFLLSWNCVYAEQVQVLENENVKIFFEPPLGQAAKEVADIYPQIKRSLEKDFGWNLDFRPSVLLLKDRNRFENLAASPLIVGFAVPKRKMIVIDYTKMAQHPFSIDNTLKHELCHLLLHHHIPGGALPRWLDEGVCQWVSDWISDIILDQKRSLLNKAALKGRFIPLDALHRGFPAGNDALILAYEQSKSFVAHIIAGFGKEGLLNVLDHVKKGEDIHMAVINVLSIPLEELEAEWQQAVRKKITWFIYLSYYLYEILFALMALVSIYAFIRIIIKKRAYMAEDAEDGLPS